MKKVSLCFLVLCDRENRLKIDAKILDWAFEKAPEAYLEYISELFVADLFGKSYYHQ